MITLNNDQSLEIIKSLELDSLAKIEFDQGNLKEIKF